jgi:hypothetical protein
MEIDGDRNCDPVDFKLEKEALALCQILRLLLSNFGLAASALSAWSLTVEGDVEGGESTDSLWLGVLMISFSLLRKKKENDGISFSTLRERVWGFVESKGQ